MGKAKILSAEDLKLKGLVEIKPGVYQKKSNPQSRGKKTWIQEQEAKALKSIEVDNMVIEDLTWQGKLSLETDVAIKSFRREDFTQGLNGVVLDFNSVSELVFQWAGKHVSLNEWYSSKHWTHRDKIKKEWHKFFKSFLIAPYPKFNKYKLELEYNSRLDPSNTITMPKLLEDMLQEEGVIPNDSKKHSKGISLIPNKEMKKFSYKITVTNLI